MRGQAYRPLLWETCGQGRLNLTSARLRIGPLQIGVSRKASIRSLAGRRPSKPGAVGARRARRLLGLRDTATVMPIVFILLGGAIVLGFLVVWGVTVLVMRDRPPEE